MEEQSDEPTSDDDTSPEKVDKYKLVAVVDSAKTFSANDVSVFLNLPCLVHLS